MAKKVGSVYAEIRADIKKLQGDFDKAHGITQASAKKIQATLDKGISFDKMAAGAVAAGASIYGAFRVVGQAIESAKIGSVLEKQSKSFDNLADAAGTSSKRILDSLKQSSQGLVAESDLMAAAGKAMLMSIPADKISELMKIAAATSKMTGQSITEAFNDITMGVARQSRMILDNLGIIVNVDDANKKYAKSLGTTADALDDAQKKQAFMNAVLEAGNDMIKRLGSSSGSLDGVNKLVAAQADLWAEVNKAVATFLDKELSGYATALKVISDLLKGMRGTAEELSKSGAWKEIEMLKSLEAKGMAQPGTAAAREAAFNERYLRPQFGLKPSEENKIKGSFTTPAWSSAGWREREGNYAANTEEQNKAILKTQEEYFKKIQDEAKKAKDAIEKLHEEVRNLESEFADSKTFSGESSNYERMEAQLRSGTEVYSMIAEKESALQKQRDKIYEEDRIANDKRWADVYAGADESARQMVEMTERTAAAMQDNFSDLFFDAMTGKLKTFQDYFKAVMDSIARMASDMAAQMATEALFGNLSKTGGGGGGGGLLGSILGMFGGSGGGYTGGNPYGAGTGDWGATMHAGGTVGVSGGPVRSIPSHYFSTAPRLHQGLAADEYPAILQKGEQVIPKGGGKSQTVVHMHFYSQSGKYDRESVSQAKSGLYASLSRANRRNS